MGFLALAMSFLPAGVARLFGALAEAVSNVLEEVFKTRAGWGLLGAAVGAGLMWLHVTGQWHADIAARMARSANAQAIEDMRQRNEASVALDMAQIRAEALDQRERDLDAKLKEIPTNAPRDPVGPVLPAERVRRILSIH